MLEFSQGLLFAATILVTVSWGLYILVVFTARHLHARVPQESAVKVPVSVAAGGSQDTAEVTEKESTPPAGSNSGSGKASQSGQTSRGGILTMASALSWMALLALTASVVLRWIGTGHPPLANHYEFAVAFCWGMILFHCYFQWRYRLRTLAVAVLPVIIGMLVYATTLSYQAKPLMPALQNSPLLTIHVFTAALAYGAAVVSFGASVMYLVGPHVKWSGWPKPESLDEIGYKAVIFTFPLLTIMIVLGAIWANIAWGSYWSWDPKETAALVTWLIYGGYLHTRVIGGWSGKRAAWLLVFGFVAIVFTYFGNLWFGGLHSYA